MGEVVAVGGAGATFSSGVGVNVLVCTAPGCAVEAAWLAIADLISVAVADGDGVVDAWASPAAGVTGVGSWVWFLSGLLLHAVKSTTIMTIHKTTHKLFTFVPLLPTCT